MSDASGISMLSGAERPAVGGGADFLVGGGEMGALMRAQDWARTPLGAVAAWPQALRSAVGIMLSSRYPIAIYWGPELALLYNDAWSAIPGRKHPGALGRPAREVWPEIWDMIGPLFERVFATGEGTWSEDQLLPMYRHGYTEECYFNFTFSPVRGEGGRVEGIFNAVIETTFRVIEERRTRVLRELGEHMAGARSATHACRLAAESLGGASADLPFCLLYLLEDDLQHCRLAASAGLPPGSPSRPETIAMNDEVAAWPLARALGSGRLEVVHHVERRFAAALPGGAWPEPATSAFVVPLAGLDAARPAGFLVAGASPRRAVDEAYRGFVQRAAAQIATVITTARAYAAERRRAEALAELDRAKTAFFSNVSHEFRTPLTLMLGTLEETLAAGDLPERRRAELSIAHRNSLRLLRLVNTLLDFSRVEAGRIEASYEPVDLAALTTELASNFRSACERAGLRFTVDCEGLPEPAYVDREMWEKIVLNLVSNAFKFTLEGEIAVRLKAEQGQAVLTVSDTGTGIPKDEQAKVFQRFHRVAGARGRTHEGTGIGLALVQELVWLHGGKVAVSSEPGAGSTFTVSIPLGLSHLPAERIGGQRRLVSTSLRAQAFVDEALRWLPGGDQPDMQVVGHDSAVEAAQVAGRALGRKRVLIVDDNADMRDYVARLLYPFHDVETARDGREALDLIRAGSPDLVLSDVMMPGMDGFELLRAVRADPAVGDTPVILLSARAGEEAQVEGLGAGADDYLVKPFSARELLARVNANLQMAELRRKALQESRAHEAALLARTAQLEAVLQTVPVAVWFTSDPKAERITSNQNAVAMLRMDRDANPSLSAPPSERPTHFRVLAGGRETRAVDLPLQRAARGEEVRDFEQEVRFDDGSAKFLLTNATPIRDASGGVVGAVAAAVDITARMQANQQRELLINELNHRVKNTLASVQSVAMQTLRNSSSLAIFQDAFVSRLVALSRAHDLLTRSNWQSASLHDIVRQTLEPYGLDSGRIAFGGPEIRLSPSAAVTLSMGLHELATNAAKYGALSEPRGRIDVRWALDGAPERPELELAWKESDGPRVTAPSRRGFGSRLIERGIAQELDGQVSLEFDAAGVQCRIRFPFSERVSVT